ncbi:MAG: endonuclease/exonuclease/phosphatase family protein [Muribaculaceae bacterium]|nr:endonuclease/exonuclease/phosphatase family protein [Muribaculaceae bacterium]
MIRNMYLALNFENFILVNTYFPYSNLSNEEFVKTRQRWDYEIHEYLVKAANRKPLIVCGDMNIVATDLDAWDNISVKKQGCFLDWEHRNFNSLLEATGLVDSYRYLHPEGRDYSYFFHNNPEYRLANQGFRIDYFLVSESLLQHVKKSEILTDIFETTNNPILIEIDF